VEEVDVTEVAQKVGILGIGFRRHSWCCFGHFLCECLHNHGDTGKPIVIKM